MRIALIGAGVIGCSTALALAARGGQVIVLERSVPGAGASSAAAGILGAQVEMHGHSREEVASFIEARNMWTSWAGMLREASGIDIGHRITGVLRTAWTEAECASLESEVAWQSSMGLRASLLDVAASRAVEPELGPLVLGSAHFPDDAQVDPPSLLRALTTVLARERRITLRVGTTVERLLVERDRCVGVKLEDGEVRADATILAAGSWSSLVAGLPASLPTVRPVRGQMVLLEERPPRVRSIVFGPRGYVVPRGDGRVLCGSTMERAGFRREVTAGGVSSILASALECVPSLGAARLAGTWSSFRPHVEGDRALLGASPLAGLFLATGHYRNGILLSKLTAERLAAAVFEAQTG